MTKASHGANPGSNVVSHTGRTLDGHPLAFNHAPSPELSPWFCWFSVTDGEIPDGAIVHDCMFNDLATLRILFGGRWTAETASGTQVFEAGDEGLTLFFGPHSKMMPISAEGKFKVMSAHLAPGASAALGGPRMAEIIDDVIDFDRMVGHGRLASRLDPEGTPRDWLAAIERELARFIAKNRSPNPDPLTTAFETCTLTNPAISVLQFAADHGVATRTVERAIRRDYGLSPKQVLRRARALDMAAALLGVAMEEEDVELRLRYFDQSHLIREFRHFFGVTPSDMRRKPHPLLRLNLETRQSRRLVALDMLPANKLEPWRDPAAEPRD